MKKIAIIVVSLFLFSCGTSLKDKSKPLYEILTEQNNGGASIQFYEILTEEKEITMLLGDENLKKKIKTSDISTSNFVILNLGEKSSGGYTLKINSVTEAENKILISVSEIAPKPGQAVTDIMSNPYTILKINSKKEIVFN